MSPTTTALKDQAAEDGRTMAGVTTADAIMAAVVVGADAVVAVVAAEAAGQGGS